LLITVACQVTSFRFDEAIIGIKAQAIYPKFAVELESLIRGAAQMQAGCLRSADKMSALQRRP